MSEKPTITEVVPIKRDNVLDLDAYRQKRIADGTWPITTEEHKRFFADWKARKK